MTNLKVNLSKNMHQANELINDFIDDISFDLVYTMYNDDNTPILMFDNWGEHKKVNDRAIERYNKDLDNLNIDYVFSDEYTQLDCCLNNGDFKLIHNNNTNYVILNDCEIFCKECLIENGLENNYFQQLTNNYKSANQLFTDDELEKYGYTRIDVEYRKGLHIGDDDEPQEILEKLQSDNNKREYIFNITSLDMFTCQFDVWYKEITD